MLVGAVHPSDFFSGVAPVFVLAGRHQARLSGEGDRMGHGEFSFRSYISQTVPCFVGASVFLKRALLSVVADDGARVCFGFAALADQ